MRLAGRIVVALAVLALAPLPLLRAPATVNAVFSDSAAVGGNAFTTAASFCSSPPASVRIVTGFEYGTYAAASDVANGSLLDGNNGVGIAVNTTMPRTGSYSMYINKTNGASSQVYKYFDPAGAPGNVATSNVVARVAIRFPSLPAADVGTLLDFWTASPTNETLELRYIAATKKFRIAFSATGQTATATTAAISANTWYVLDFKLKIGNPTTVDWRVNGADQPQLTRTGNLNGYSDLEFGSVTGADAYQMYVDDVLVSTDLASYPLPDGGVRALTPDAVTAVANTGSQMKDDADANVAVATPGAAAKLGGVPMTGTTSFVKQVGTTNTNYAEVSFTDAAGTGCVNGVGAVVAQHGSNATGGRGDSRIYDDAGTLHGYITPAATTISGTGIQYRTAPITPADGSWTVADLNAARARMGYSNNATAANYPAWDALMLEYDQS